MALNRTLMHIEVKETDANRTYWTTQSWIQKTGTEVRDAEIILVPWLNFREGAEVLFPNGTTEFYRALKDAMPDLSIAIAVDPDRYEQVALHSVQQRWPTLLVKYAAIPLVIGLLTNRIDDAIFRHGPDTPMQMEVIVEGEQGRCISVRYEGPITEFTNELLRQVDRCLPEIASKPQNVPDKPKPTAGGAEPENSIEPKKPFD